MPAPEALKAGASCRASISAKPGRRGGLTAEQLSRAKETLGANLEATVRLDVLAWQCRLSARHFARAFRAATGTTPHRWRAEKRLETARMLMLAGALPLSEIALCCGFSDQSHLTRAFSKAFGASPGAWARRQRQAAVLAA